MKTLRGKQTGTGGVSRQAASTISRSMSQNDAMLPMA